MPTCLNCGQEVPLSPGGEPQQICEQCRSLAIARMRSQSQKPGFGILVRRMPVTSAIIAVNVLVFLAMTLSGASPMRPNRMELLKWGADFAPLVVTTQPWRMLTSNYVHIGIFHLLVNMWCLWNLGMLAERIFERWTYILTYTVCGLAGSIASLWWHPVGGSAGASGAVFGMAGALISALYLGHLPVHPSALKSTLKSLASFAGYNLLFGAVIPGIDNSAHIGGLLTGLGLGATLARHLTSSPDERNTWRNGVFAVAVIILFCAFYFVRRSLLHAFGDGPGS